MAEDVFSSLCRAANDCSEVILTVYNVSGPFRPHAVFNHLGTGVPTVAAINVELDILTFIPINQIKEVAFTGRSFNPDPRFDRRDRRYHNAFAIVQRI
jgi:hypothetical protein